MDAYNRLPQPAAIASKHFFYLGLAPKVPTEAVDAVVHAAKKLAQQYGLNPAQIEVFSRTQLESAHAGAGEAFATLRRACGLPERIPGAVVVCEWASPHVDDTFAGQAFVSLVLHTGPEPYVMQAFHTEHTSSGQTALVTSTRVLHQGDLAVFDPTTAHFTAPRHPNADQLLVLLQFELADYTEQDREILLQRFPPASQDKDAAEVFNGLL